MYKIKINEKILPTRYIDCKTKEEVYKHYKYLVYNEDYDEDQLEVIECNKIDYKEEFKELYKLRETI